MLSKNSQKEYYIGVRKCYQRTARRNITVELESVIKGQQEGILHAVELGSVIKE